MSHVAPKSLADWCQDRSIELSQHADDLNAAVRVLYQLKNLMAGLGQSQQVEHIDPEQATTDEALAILRKIAGDARQTTKRGA